MHTAAPQRLRTLLLDVGLPAAVLFALTLVIYGASLSNNFVSWDDNSLIYSNTIVRGMTAENVREAFTTYDPELYIPLTLLSWQIDYMAGGLQPFVYHFGNMLLHAFSALLVLLLIRKLTGKAWLGWFCGLLFAVHPLHVETVAWASARKDVLSTFFCLAAMLCYVHYAPPAGANRGRWWIYATSVVLFALALLSKVSVVMLPVVLLLIDWMRRRTVTRMMLLDKLPYFTLSVALGIVALFGKREILESTGTTEKLLMATKSTVFYMQKLFVPTDLTAIYPYIKPITISSSDFAVPAALVTGLLVFTLWLARRWREAAFGLLFFFVTLLPSFANFAKDSELYFASDRYAYLPSVGIFLLVGLCIDRLVGRSGDTRSQDRNAGVAAVGCVMVLVIFGLLATAQTGIWRNSEILFRDALKKQPDSVAAHINLAIFYRETGRLDEALIETRAAFAIRPRMEVYTNFANIYKLQGKLDLAKAEYQKAIAAFPDKPEPHMGLGIIAQEQGRYEEAIAAYNKALELEPRFVAALINMGSVYEHTGKLDDAERTFLRAVEINPSFADGWHALGIVHEQQKRFTEAAADYRKALALNPASVESSIQLAAAELSLGRPAEALSILKDVLKRDPENTTAKALLNEMIKRGIVGTK